MYLSLDNIGLHASICLYIIVYTSNDGYPWGTRFSEGSGDSTISSSGSNTAVFAVNGYVYKIQLVAESYFSITLEEGDVDSLGGIMGKA